MNKKRILSLLMTFAMLIGIAPLVQIDVSAQTPFDLQIIARSIADTAEWGNDSSPAVGVPDWGTCKSSGVNWWSIPPHTGDPPDSHCICTTGSKPCWADTTAAKPSPDNLKGTVVTVPAGGGTGLTATLTVPSTYASNRFYTNIILATPGVNTRSYAAPGTPAVPEGAQIRVTNVSFGTIDTAKNSDYLANDELGGAASFSIWDAATHAYSLQNRRLVSPTTAPLSGTDVAVSFATAPTTLTITFDIFYDAPTPTCTGVPATCPLQPGCTTCPTTPTPTCTGVVATCPLQPGCTTCPTTPNPTNPQPGANEFALHLIARSIGDTSDWANDSSPATGVPAWGTCKTSNVNWWDIPPHTGDPPDSHCTCLSGSKPCWADTSAAKPSPDNLKGLNVIIPNTGGTGYTATLTVPGTYATNRYYTNIALVTPGVNTRSYAAPGTPAVPEGAQLRVTAVSFGTIDTAKNSNYLASDDLGGAASFSIWDAATHAYSDQNRRLANAVTMPLSGTDVAVSFATAPTVLTVTFDVFFDTTNPDPVCTGNAATCQIPNCPNTHGAVNPPTCSGSYPCELPGCTNAACQPPANPQPGANEFALHLIARSIGDTAEWSNDSSIATGVPAWGTCKSTNENWYASNTGDPPATHCKCGGSVPCWADQAPAKPSPDALKGLNVIIPNTGGTGLTASLVVPAAYASNRYFTNIILVTPGVNTRGYAPAGTPAVPEGAQVRVTAVSFGTIDTSKNSNYLTNDDVGGAGTFSIWDGFTHAFTAQNRRLVNPTTTPLSGNDVALTFATAPTVLTVTFDVFFGDNPDPVCPGDSTCTISGCTNNHSGTPQPTGDGKQIELVGVGTTNWVVTRSNAIEAADGTHELTLTFATPVINVMQLAIMSAGGFFDANTPGGPWKDSVKAPDLWNSEDFTPHLTFNSIKINGTDYTLKARENTNLVQFYSPPQNGYIVCDIWNGWYAPAQIVNGVTTYLDETANNGLGFNVGAPVTTITVNFTIVGTNVQAPVCTGNPMTCKVPNCPTCPKPTESDKVNVELVMRNSNIDPATNSFTYTRSPKVEIDGHNREYTLTISNLTDVKELMSLSILTAGGMADDPFFKGLPKAPASWQVGNENGQMPTLQILSIMFNGNKDATPTSPFNRTADSLVGLPTGWDVANGYVAYDMFNGWWWPHNRKINNGQYVNGSGVDGGGVKAHQYVNEDGPQFGANEDESSPATAPVLALGMADGSAITSVEVKFRTLNMPLGDPNQQTTCPGNSTCTIPNCPGPHGTAQCPGNSTCTIPNCPGPHGTVTPPGEAARFRATGMVTQASRDKFAVDSNIGPGMADALQILRCLVKLTNDVTAGGPKSAAWYASLITHETITDTSMPGMADALQVLRYVVKLSTKELVVPGCRNNAETCKVPECPCKSVTPPVVSGAYCTLNKDTCTRGATCVCKTMPTTPPAGMDKNAKEIVKAMGMGWNLGNTFDAHDRNKFAIHGGAGYELDDIPLDHSAHVRRIETSWLGGPSNVTTLELIKAIKAQGFNTIRVPVTWHKVADPEKEWEIWKPFMDRVQEVVDMAYNEGMYVIINVHHDDAVISLSSGPVGLVTENNGKITDEDKEQSMYVLARFWEQIGERFKNYDQRLIFEGLNEPRTVGSNGEWTGGTTHERLVLRELNQHFVSVVRSQGGNNAWRMLMVPTYAANGKDATPRLSFAVPADLTTGRLAISLHDYAPFGWAHDGRGTYQDISEITVTFDEVKELMDSKYGGIPVVLGEWGSIHRTDSPESTSTAQRAKHAEDFVYAAISRGMVPVLWDNAKFEGSGINSSGFGIFNRQTYQPHGDYQDIVDGMKRGLAKAG
ncbi:MAG: glycoside hydrolase family 5 protein [Oscillospiraceae bacterium]|nr:glycoside hydrolase family 5 protein [Oscillospiraceae bacterium]